MHQLFGCPFPGGRLRHHLPFHLFIDHSPDGLFHLHIKQGGKYEDQYDIYDDPVDNPFDDVFPVHRLPLKSGSAS